MITASESSWTAPFTGLSPRCFHKLVNALRRDGADAVRRGRPWSLPFDDRVLLVADYWRTNLTLSQIGPLFGISKSAADRVINHLGPLLALRPHRRFRKDTVLIVDSPLVPTRDHTVAEQSKNYRYSATGLVRRCVHCLRCSLVKYLDMLPGLKPVGSGRPTGCCTATRHGVRVGFLACPPRLL